MITYPSINLPDYYTYLLRVNIMGTVKAFHEYSAYISENKSFLALVQQSFKDVDQKGRVSVILRSLGWHNFRNRLVNIFLYYSTTGSFLINGNVDFSKELVNFEKKLDPFEVEGYSRGFLLAFYLKMGRLYLNQLNLEYADQLTIRDDLLEFLSYSRSKIIKIDWILVVISHLEHFLGRKILHDHLEKGAGYESLYSSLKDSQKEIMIKNCLSYGYSINEPDIFTMKTV